MKTQVLIEKKKTKPKSSNKSAGKIKRESKMNCWEFKKCGREPGGKNAKKEGICPAAVETTFDGFHSGKNAGRACWAVAGTFCGGDGGEPRGTYAQKFLDCTKCDFHHRVILEEKEYKSAVAHLRKIKKGKKKRRHKEPGFIKHVFAKSKTTAEDNLEIESSFISFLVAWTSFCPSISMIEASKRLCKEDLIDELMVIDAISDNPNKKAASTFFKTVFKKGIRRQVENYFDFRTVPDTNILVRTIKSLNNDNRK